MNDVAAPVVRRIPGPGDKLRREREQRGFQLQEVAHSLRFTVQQVRDLEDDEYGDFAAPTYVRGYLRTYARFLEVDIEDEVAAAHALRDTEAAEVLLNQPNEKQTKGLPVLPVVAVLAVVVGGAWWWQQSETDVVKTGERVILAESQAEAQTNPSTDFADSVAANADVLNQRQVELLEGDPGFLAADGSSGGVDQSEIVDRKSSTLDELLAAVEIISNGDKSNASAENVDAGQDVANQANTQSDIEAADEIAAAAANAPQSDDDLDEIELNNTNTAAVDEPLDGATSETANIIDEVVDQSLDNTAEEQTEKVSGASAAEESGTEQNATPSSSPTQRQSIVLKPSGFNLRIPGVIENTPQTAEPQPPVEEIRVASRTPATPVRSQDASRLQPNLNDRRRLLLYFDDESWADVRDRYDARLLYESVEKGRVVLLEGEPPFQVFLGNSSAVRVQYNGNFTDFEPDASGLFARFSVGDGSQ